MIIKRWRDVTDYSTVRRWSRLFGSGEANNAQLGYGISIDAAIELAKQQLEEVEKQIDSAESLQTDGPGEVEAAE